MCGTKLAYGATYTSLSAAHPNNRGEFTVEKRAAKVPKMNLKTRNLYQKSQYTQRGKVGPFEAKSSEFGARDGPSPHAVVGFVLGAFGELPSSCYSLCPAIARG